MKLSKLFVIVLLAGTLGVFGCSDDPETGNGGSGGTAGSGGTGGTGGTAGSGGTGGTGGTAGSGGTGGSPDAFCEEGDCATDTQRADACETWVTGCVALVGEAAEGLCILVFEYVFCGVNGGTGGTGGTAGTGGAGGTAGTGGSGGTAGTGGGGGTGGTPDLVVCDEKLCLEDNTRRQICALGVAACIAEDLLPPQEEECVAGVVAIICRK